MCLKQLQARKPAPVFDYLWRKASLWQVWTSLDKSITHPITGYQGEEFSTSRSTSSPRQTLGSQEITPQPPFLQTRQAQGPQGLLTGPSFQPHHQLCYLPLDAWRTFTFFLNCGAQNCSRYLRWGSAKAGCSGIITPLDQLLMLGLLNLRLWVALLAARAHCWVLEHLLTF